MSCYKTCTQISEPNTHVGGNEGGQYLGKTVVKKRKEVEFSVGFLGMVCVWDEDTLSLKHF